MDSCQSVLIIRNYKRHNCPYHESIIRGLAWWVRAHDSFEQRG